MNNLVLMCYWVINMKKFYTAKYDRVFKTILCDEDNPHMMQEFLSRLLNRKVEIVKFLRNELPIRNTEEKVKTIDVLVKSENKYIHIELNTNYENWLHIRNFVYFSTVFTKKTKRGEVYDTESEFIHIDFTYNLDIDDEFKKYYVMSDDGHKYIDNVEIIEYNMDKIMQFWYDLDEKKINEYKHLIMLDLESSDLKKISKGDEFMEEFENKLTNLNEDETFQSAMTYEEDQKLILNTTKKYAYEQGVKEKENDIVINMLNKNCDISFISDITKLSLEEIDKIKNENNL